jgi:hypothetical protein
MLYLDGVYAEDNYGKTRIHPIKAPTKSELNSLTHRICPSYFMVALPTGSCSIIVCSRTWTPLVHGL